MAPTDVGKCGHRKRGFTILELMAAFAVLSIVMLVLLGITDATGKIWRNAGESTAVFQEARAAFDLMTRRLALATLNTYYDYYDASGRAASDVGYSGTPSRYGRQSELHFLIGRNLVPSQAPWTDAVFFWHHWGLAGPETMTDLEPRSMRWVIS